MPDTGHAPTASLDHRMISVTDVYFALNKSSKRAVGYDTAAFFIAVQVWHRQQKILPLSSWMNSIFYSCSLIRGNISIRGDPEG